MAVNETVLDVHNLSAIYRGRRGSVQALRQVSFEIKRGEALALIGESGSGKTTLGLALIGLLPPSASITEGRIIYHERAADGGNTIDLLTLRGRRLRRWRWHGGAMVFQGAQNAFNPVLRIAEHFRDTAQAHGYLRGRDLEARAMDLLSLVRLDAERVWRAFPHELSGGMRQRVLIALSLLLSPQLLILDEPTTALDLLTQRSIIELLHTLRRELNLALIVISHDLALAAELADRVATIYAGRIVEIAPAGSFFRAAAHPYTIGLLNALPSLTRSPAQLAAIPGTPPNLAELPAGCPFHPRCPLADDRSRSEEPPLITVGPEHQAACWHWQAAQDRRVELFTKAEPHVHAVD
jgi:peptide/nickel transport system ATP-binding protein